MYKKHTKADLENIASHRHLNTSGTKRELIERLLKYDDSHNEGIILNFISLLISQLKLTRIANKQLNLIICINKT